MTGSRNRSAAHSDAEIAVSAVLLDLDGVLVDSTAAIERQWREFSDWYDLDAEQVLGQIHGRRSIDSVDNLLAGRTPSVRQAAHERLQRLELEDQHGVRALPGAADLLQALPATAVAVVTSGTREVAKVRIRAAGLAVPAVLVGADNVEHGKPNAEGYLQAARALNCEPSAAVVVEDTPAGLSAGRALGAALLALTTTHAADDLRPLLGPRDRLAPDLSHVRVERPPDGRVVLRLLD